MTSEKQVIEFGLGDERYCIDIDVISEIVGTDDGELTALPGAPGHIEGIMHLRGEATTIVNPLSLLDVDDGTTVSTVSSCSTATRPAARPTVGWLNTCIASPP